MNKTVRLPGALSPLIAALLLAACSGSEEPVDHAKADSAERSAGNMAASQTAKPEAATFTNPLNDSGPDPWMTWYDGHYYLAATTWGDATVGLTMRKAETIQGLKEAEPRQIWQDDTEDRCCNFWAPEFFLLDGPNGRRWYGYFTGGAAGDDFVNTQFMHVIESEGTDPLGPYTYKGKQVERNAWTGPCCSSTAGCTRSTAYGTKRRTSRSAR